MRAMREHLSQTTPRAVHGVLRHKHARVPGFRLRQQRRLLYVPCGLPQCVAKSRDTRNETNSSKCGESATPSKSGRQPRNGVAGQYPAEIANAIDEARCGSTSLP